MDNYTWVYFLDDSWEDWLVDMPTGGVLYMPNIEGYENGTRNFLIPNDLAYVTATYHCTVNVVEDVEMFERLLTSASA